MNLKIIKLKPTLPDLLHIFIWNKKHIENIWNEKAHSNNQTNKQILGGDWTKLLSILFETCKSDVFTLWEGNWNSAGLPIYRGRL